MSTDRRRAKGMGWSKELLEALRMMNGALFNVK